MERPVRISTLDWQIKDGKPQTRIVSVETDLFKLPISEMMTIIHVAISKNQKVIIEPIAMESLTVFVSGHMDMPVV